VSCNFQRPKDFPFGQHFVLLRSYFTTPGLQQNSRPVRPIQSAEVGDFSRSASWHRFLSHSDVRSNRRALNQTPLLQLGNVLTLISQNEYFENSPSDNTDMFSATASPSGNVTYICCKNIIAAIWVNSKIKLSSH